MEDELHFLLKCPKLEEKRLLVLNDIYLKYKNISLLDKSQAFVWLMTAEDPYVIRSVIKLLLVLFSERDSILHI